ncbi:site-specific integrase [Arthrobacter sp. CDRTa11]|uniref:tyrosine-type recombinase/integrase n=1 Tax=Arthrobacter sp. CDRTa11 TaxID=2651199 RepID=UPI002265DACF|nr:site-specific integrase [Arthrobacter sp. CDRTa11]UZX04027.1 site-specific integrase [Arthrobacter sp. CDRTa11]
MASIQKRDNGSWRARYRDDSGKEHARHFPRKIDAQKWLDEVTSSVVTGSYVDPKLGRVTLNSFFAEWSQRQIWAAGTAKAMSLAVRSCTFGDVEFRNLRRSHVESWVKQMTVRGLAPGTVKTRFNNVRSVLRGARNDRLLAVDPADGVSLPRARKAEHAMAIPSPCDVGKLLEAAEVQFRPFVAMCAFAGLRLGEAAAIQLTDIDFLRRTLKVQRQVQRAGKGEVAITLPKYGSERLVHIPDALVQMLAHHVQHVGVHSVHQWLFVGDGGLPPHQNTSGYWWRKTVAAAGLSNVRLHDLRHFYASGLIAAGCDVVTVQRALGHSKATTTLNTYSHLWPTAEDRTRSAAGAMMNEALSISADPVRTAGA